MSEAYEVLKDDEKRARYDQYGEMGVNENGGGYQASNVNMDELLRHFADIFGGEARSLAVSAVSGTTGTRTRWTTTVRTSRRRSAFPSWIA